MSKQLSGNVPGARAPEAKTGHGPTARGFEPLRAEPNGFLVHHLNHSVTLSCSSSLKTDVLDNDLGAGAWSHVENCKVPAAFGRHEPDLHAP